MKKLIATAFAAGIVAAGLTATQAYAETGTFDATYGCNSATFTNSYAETVGVNYGTASSGDAKNVQVPAGKSVTVTSTVKNFGYTATLVDGTQVGILEWPGVDLTAKCAGDTKTKKTTAPAKTTKPATKAKDTKGGLAKTGV
ncbi:MAG: hypothetical protein Q4F67_02490 [Propionibacteriaceae bacterium]|nr:hypothetical protein [Propionibacteriaceae bacterium]